MDKSILSNGKIDKKPLLNRRILVFVAAAYTIGLVLGARLAMPVLLYFLLAAPFLMGAVFLHKKTLVAGVLLLVMCVFLGMGMINIALAPKYTALDISMPVTLQGRVSTRTLKDGYASYLLTEVKVDDKKINGNVILSSQNMAYITDDILLAQATLRVPDSASFPEGFDDFKYCMSKGVLYRASAHTDAAIGKAGGVLAFINGIRRGVNNQIERIFVNEAPLVKALVIGEEEDIDPQTASIFGLAGITHVLAISGSHVMMMCGLVAWCVKRLKISHTWRFIIEQLFLVFYVLLTGLQISMIRAALMYEMILLARYFGKQIDTLTSLAAAYLLITIFFPAQVFDLGLQLSFGAVFSLICLAPKFGRLLHIHNKTINQTLAATLAATIGLLPILINVSHYVWLPGLFINAVATLYSLILIPVLSLLVGVSFLLPFRLIGIVGELLVYLLVWLAKVGLPLQNWGIYLPNVAFYLLLAWYAVLFFISDYVFISWRPKTLSAGLIVAVYTLSMLLPLAKADKQISIKLIDSGGISAIIHTETGEDVLISLGGTNYLIDYVIGNNLYFSSAHFWERTPDAFDNVARLLQMGKVKELYAAHNFHKVLVNKYGILSAQAYTEEALYISPRCKLVFVREPNAQTGEVIGAMLLVDEQAICLLTSMYEEELAVGDVPVIVYADAQYVDWAQQSAPQLIIMRERQWGSMAHYTKLFARQVINTFEAGMIEMSLQEDGIVVVETMYESK